MEASMNQASSEIVKEIMDNSDRLDCTIEEVDEATVLDVGINVRGTEKLGQLVAEIAMGGRGVVKLSKALFGDLTLPVTIAATDMPTRAIICSQIADWEIEVGDFAALASGPAKALAQTRSFLGETNCDEISDSGVILLDTRQTPTPEVIAYLAKRCGISPSGLFCILSPTASKVGSIRIASRILEAGILKAYKLGFHPHKVRSVYGVAPIPPVAENDKRAIEVSNQCIMYGGSVFFYVRTAEEEDLHWLASKIPFSCDQHEVVSGKSGIYFDVGYQEMVSIGFGPAEATITNIETQKSYSSGSRNSAALKEALADY
jgi:methenyltetrahydromethanopterin cyclohydrolase